jgi:hypothetical protein
MAAPDQYKALMTEIIKKQIVILGPDISVLKARNVKSIEVSDDGTVTEISGDPQAVLQQLIDEYVALSGQIVKNILGSIMDKYPEIKVNVG